MVDGDGNPLQVPYRLDMADLVWEVDQHGRFARGLNTDELVEIESQKVIKMLATKADSADTATRSSEGTVTLARPKSSWGVYEAALDIEQV